MPSTIIASSSSRILREPRSAAIAEPPAPAMSSAVAMGPASRTMASTAAEPVNDWAPNCLISPPTCSAITAPNGIATSAVGTIVTDAMNQACWMNSRSWKGRRKSWRPTSRPNAKSLPAVPIGCSTLGGRVRGHLSCLPVAIDICGSKEPGGGVMPFSRHHAPGSRWLRRGMPLEGSSWSGIGGSGGRSSSFSAASSSASFSSDMPIGPTRWALRNWRTTGSSELSSISRGPNIARCRW